MMQKTDQYFSGDAARELVGILPTSEEVKRPDDLLKEYKILIQDRSSSGSQYLRTDSILLIQLQQEVNS